jgi:hypothetical protein
MTSGTTSGSKFESAWPWAGALIVAAAWEYFGPKFPEPPDSVLGTAATVASVFASFLGVSEALLLTIKDTAAIKKLSEHGYSVQLLAYLRSGIYASVSFAVLSIAGYFIDHHKLLFHHHVYSAFVLAWVTAASMSLFSYARVSHLFFKLLKHTLN